ncbi:MAG: hypothetical protein U9Q30_08000 [Campylobacterota bacterium]|nr:hypothetical protein [Campylobacterota bacterium]
MEKDKWEIALDNQKIVVEQCQESKNIDSCMRCTEVLKCEVRKIYVNSVYQSMNKGAGGGFEF